MSGDDDMSYQPDLFSSTRKEKNVDAVRIRVFADDEILNSLQHLPFAGAHNSFPAYKEYLQKNLPYNSLDTRIRRANYILERFYPDADLHTPLTFYTKIINAQDDLKPILFYHLAKSETILARVAEGLIYPALPVGKIDRGQLKEFIQLCLPETKPASIQKVIRAVTNSYHLLDVGRQDQKTIRFQLRPGTLGAFLYLLASEYPQPGIYSFDSLFAGPIHRWLLWDREWIRMQLYALRDMQIISKVSEIDTIRQFSLASGQWQCLEQYSQAVLVQGKRGK